jgi:hypothetical protein
MKIKNKEISPKAGLRIVAYTLFAYWAFTAYERVQVLGEYGGGLEWNAKSFKYFFGLTLSADEVRSSMEALKGLEELKASFRR